MYVSPLQCNNRECNEHSVQKVTNSKTVPFILISPPSEDGCIKLFEAIQHNDNKVLEAILTNWDDPDIYTVDAKGNTALHYATKRCHALATMMLLNIAPQLASIPNKKGRLPLHYAIKKNARISALGLIEKTANFDAPDAVSYSPLHYAIFAMNPFITQKLLAHGANVRQKAAYHQTVWHLFAQAELPTEKSLKARKKSVRDRLPPNPWKAMIQLLKEARDLINQQDTFGKTALHYAVTTPQDCRALLLLEYGADPTIEDDNELLPSDYVPQNLLNDTDKGKKKNNKYKATRLFFTLKQAEENSYHS